MFDISAPKEILSAFGPDWATTTLAIKKWNEKKDAIEAVIAAADTPKLAPGDYSGLIDVLKKLAVDAHATVAQYAIRALGFLANGLRQAFHDHAISAVPVLFSKFKEKRLTEEILTTLEKFMRCINLAEIIEPLEASKTEKMPLTKQNIMVFTERAIRTTYIDTLEEIVDKLAPLALAVADEKDANCREQGLVVLGVLTARVPTMM